MTTKGHDSRSHTLWRQSASADSSSKLEYSKWQSGSSHYEELLCQWACSQTADLSAGTVIAATTLQDCRRSVTAVKVRAMDGRAKASRDQERSRAVRRVPRRPSGGRAGSSSAPRRPRADAQCLFATAAKMVNHLTKMLPHLTKMAAPSFLHEWDGSPHAPAQPAGLRPTLSYLPLRARTY